MGTEGEQSNAAEQEAHANEQPILRADSRTSIVRIRRRRASRVIRRWPVPQPPTHGLLVAWRSTGNGPPSLDQTKDHPDRQASKLRWGSRIAKRRHGIA